MTLDFEIRATRRPLPRQLELSSDWSAETPSSKASSSSSGDSFPPAYSVRIPMNRYDAHVPSARSSNQESWSASPSYASANSQLKSFELAARDPTPMSTRRSVHSVTGSDWVQQDESLASGSARRMMPSVASSSQYPDSKQSWRNQGKDESSASYESKDNQREETHYHPFQPRESIASDATPLRHWRDSTASESYGNQLNRSRNRDNFRASGAAQDEPRLQEKRRDDAIYSTFHTTAPTRPEPSRDRKVPVSHDVQFSSPSPTFSKRSPSASSSSKITGADSRSSTRSLAEKSEKLHWNSNDKRDRRGPISPPPSPQPSESTSEGHEDDTRHRFASRTLSSFHAKSPGFRSRSKTASSSSDSSDGSKSHDLVRSMSERREELYAFKTSMRAAFERVDEMVDAHREFFKSDPRSGSPIYDEQRADKAVRLAEDVSADLARLRDRFRQLAEVFRKGEDKDACSTPSSRHRNASDAKRERVTVRVDKRGARDEDQQHASRSLSGSRGDSSCESAQPDRRAAGGRLLHDEGADESTNSYFASLGHADSSDGDEEEHKQDSLRRGASAALADLTRSTLDSDDDVDSDSERSRSGAIFPPSRRDSIDLHRASLASELSPPPPPPRLQGDGSRSSRFGGAGESVFRGARMVCAAASLLALAPD